MVFDAPALKRAKGAEPDVQGNIVGGVPLSLDPPQDFLRKVKSRGRCGYGYGTALFSVYRLITRFIQSLEPVILGSSDVGGGGEPCRSVRPVESPILLACWV